MARPSTSRCIRLTGCRSCGTAISCSTRRAPSSPISRSYFRRPRCSRIRPRPGTDEPVDQRGEFLLLPVHDLSRLTRAERVPRLGSRPTRRSLRMRCPRSRSGCRSRSSTLARAGFPARRRGDARRLLPDAEHPFVRAHSRGQDDVRETFRWCRRGANGWKPADGPVVPRRATAGRASIAHAREMGRSRTGRNTEFVRLSLIMSQAASGVRDDRSTDLPRKRCRASAAL